MGPLLMRFILARSSSLYLANRCRLLSSEEIDVQTLADLVGGIEQARGGHVPVPGGYCQVRALLQYEWVAEWV